MSVAANAGSSLIGADLTLRLRIPQVYWYGRNYYEAAPPRNPQGPGEGRYRVLRGGSWLDTPDTFLTCSYRSWARQEERSPTIGFRCVKNFPGTPGKATASR